MVFCLKHFLPLLVLPYPTAAPLFVSLYLVSVFLATKPCIYCTALLSVLFTSTCYTHLSNLPAFATQTGPSGVNVSVPSPPPSTSLLAFPSLLPNATVPHNFSLSLTSPDPVRCWCDANRLRLFDPVLVGYRRRDEIFSGEDARDKLGADAEEASQREADRQEAEDRRREEDQEASRPKTRIARALDVVVPSWVAPITARLLNFTRQGSEPNTPAPMIALPPPPPPRWDSTRQRLDLRTRGSAAAGVGFILDFGWGRGETTVQEDLERARIKRRGPILEVKMEDRKS